MKLFVCLNIQAHIKNSFNLLGEKYLNESHRPMHRIRLLECRAYFIELPSTFKMHNFICKTSLFPFILVQETAVKLLINSSLYSMRNYFIFQAFQASTKQKVKLCASLHKHLTENADTYYMQLSLILQCFQDIFIIYQFQIMLWNGAEGLKNGLKKHISNPPKCSTQLFKSTKKKKKTTVHSAMTLHVVKYGTFVLWRQHIGMIIIWSEKGKVQLKAKTCLWIL